MHRRWQVGLIAFVVDGCASPLPDVDADASASTIEASDVTVGSMTMESTTGSMTMESTTGSTTTGEASTSIASSTSSGGEGIGVCGQACGKVVECVPMGGNEADFQCTDGFCEYIGPPPPACDDTTCPAAAGLACADVNGVDICTIPCTDGGTECDVVMLECTGMDDDGNMICQAPPCGGAAEGEPCTFGGADQFGVCMGGECTCTDDAECTATGYACNH